MRRKKDGATRLASKQLAKAARQKSSLVSLKKKSWEKMQTGEFTVWKIARKEEKVDGTSWVKGKRGSSWHSRKTIELGRMAKKGTFGRKRVRSVPV